MSLPGTDWSPPPDEAPLPVGSRVGRYEVRGVLGSGACAVVYDAEHHATGRRVALKTLRPELAEIDVMQARFRREVRVLGALHAPNLVDAIDAGTLEDGMPFLVLERLEGPTLGALLERGPLELGAAIEVMHGVLEALSVLHAEGIVHRDLKPENIVIHQSSTGPVVKLLDLGVCAFVDDLTRSTGGSRRGKLTSSGLWIGTPCYMSPEQVDGRGVDARTDVYGAGVVLYECLTGRTPFEGTSTLDVISAVLRRPVIPPSVLREDCPRALDALVLKAVERKASARPQTAAELWRDLAAIATKHGLVSGSKALAALPDPATPTLPLVEADDEEGDATVSGVAVRRHSSTPRAVSAPGVPLRRRGRWIGAILAAAAIGAAVVISTQIVAPASHPLLIAPAVPSEPPSPRASARVVIRQQPFAAETSRPLAHEKAFEPVPVAAPITTARATSDAATPPSAWASADAPERSPAQHVRPSLRPAAQTPFLSGSQLAPEPPEWAITPPAQPFIPDNPYARGADGPGTPDEVFPDAQP